LTNGDVEEVLTHVVEAVIFGRSHPADELQELEKEMAGSVFNE